MNFVFQISHRENDIAFGSFIPLSFYPHLLPNIFFWFNNFELISLLF